MRKFLLLACGIIPCLLATSIAAAKAPTAAEGSVNLDGYSTEEPSGAVTVSDGLPALSKSGTGHTGSEGLGETDLSDYESFDAVIRENADGTYEILDSDGSVVAIYENTARGIQPRVGWEIDWTVDAGVQTGAESRFESYDGLAFAYDISFSRTGNSKIGYANHDKKTVTWVESSSDGFYGGFSFTKNIGLVSLAIKNNSNNTITYTGVYYAVS